jgi:PAS domain S-box-containing protein
MSAIDYRLLFHRAPAILLVLTPEFEIVEATEDRLRVTGTKRDEILGRNLFQVFPDNPADPSATGVKNLRASLERVVRTRRPDAMALQKYDIRRPDSDEFEERFWSPFNVPILRADGSIAYLIHRVEDATDFIRMKQQREQQAQVTADLRARNEAMEVEIFRRAQEIQAANEKLRVANEAMVALDRAKTTFFNNASHELRTPLMLVLGPLEAVLEGVEPLPSLAAQQMRVAVTSARRMQKLVSGLLDFARIEAGRLEPQVEPTDIVGLTRELAEGFRPAIERGGLNFSASYGPVPKVSIDPTIWEKIVLNLLSNALKFTRRGEIGLSLAARGPTLELQVIDTGVGIPVTELPRIFERFYQVPNREGRSAEGTGIGLALVKELVELLHGTVRVESQPGAGARFVVTLPLQAAAGAPVARREAERGELVRAYAAETAGWNLAHDESGASDGPRASPCNGGEQPDARRLVLVVEDNADMRGHLSRLLSERYAVHTVEHAEAAWVALEQCVPALILTDVMLPKTDGLEFLRQLRRHERWKTLPVLVLTARAEESASIAGLESGADDFLLKPFSARELIARVDAHIKMAELRNETAARERALREEAEFQRRRLESIIASVTDSFVLLDPAFRIVYLNQREAELLGRPISELPGTIIWDSLPDYARELAEPKFLEALQSRTAVVFEYRDQLRNLWFEKRAHAVEGGVAVFSVDISARKRQEKLSAAKYEITRTLAAASHLEEATMGVLRQLCQTVDATVGCLWLKTADGEFLEHAFSYCREDECGRLADFLAQTRTRKLAPGASLPGRVWVARKVTWIPVLAQDAEFTRRSAAQAAGLVSGVGVPVAVENEVVGTIELFLRYQISPTDPAFSMLAAAGSEFSQFVKRQRAESEQRRLTSIVHSSNEAILGLTLDGVITNWNTGAERLYGYAAADVMGRTLDQVVPSERRQEIQEARERVGRGDVIEPFETVRVRKDGSRIHVFLSLSPIRDDTHRIVGISAIGRDITEQRRAEEIEHRNRELQMANHRAEEASQMKDDFLAHMSHELRTPLHGIIGFSEFLVDEKVGALNPTQKEFLNDVLNSARHLLKLINNVLDLSKVEAGQLELFPEPVHLGQLIQEVCTIIRPLANQHAVEIHFAPDSGDFKVSIDPLRVRQVLYNLLANAVQYNHPGGSATILVARDEQGNHFEIVVADTGIGIAAGDIGRVFEEFRQLKTPLRGKGTGLGLAVTKRLVECMQGSIGVESEVDRGTRFTVRLPVIAPTGSSSI